MYCRHCGALIPDDSVFCPKCGKNVGEAEAQVEKTIPESVEQDKKEKTEQPAEWYYQDNFGGGFGPCKQADIETAIRRGKVSSSGEVRRGTDGDWVAITRSRFADYLCNLPPKQVAISDKWIWCLAIIPLIASYFLDRYGAGLGLTYLPWIAPLALNFLFIWLDQKELINAELLAESWMYMGILLVPVYLLIREIKTNHNYSPVIVWCFLFALDFII